MSNYYKFVVNEEDSGVRIDKFLSYKLSEANITRSSIQKMIDKGYVLVNNIIKQNNYKIKNNDIIDVNIPKPEIIQTLPENIPLNIIYEDDDLLVVNKPKGMVVHPAIGNYNGTLVNALLFHCAGTLSGINGKIRPGIVHRIDKDTSGLLIVAKNDFSHHKLALQIKEHSFNREYEAIVYGNFKNESGTIDAPIGRNLNDRKKMAVTDKSSKNAITYYKVLNRFNGFTHIRLKLETGRTHQIRVHMAYIGHPVAGDTVYGPKKIIKSLNGQCLHAKLIGFNHPRDNRYLEFESELPDYFKKFLLKLEKGI